MHYVAIMDKENSTFGIHFPDFPGCIAVGETEEEVMANARESLAFHVDGMLEDGETIPQATTLAEIKNQKALEDAYIVTAIPLVTVLGRPVRVNLSIDAGKLKAIDAEAKARGLTRSAFLVSAALKHIA